MGDETKHIGFNVPIDECEEWMSEKEEMNMTNSEFCRSMIRAGRRNLNLTDAHPDNQGTNLDEIENEVIKCLSSTDAKSFNEIIDSLVGDIEDEVQEVLLENEDATYIPKEDGYILEN